MRGGFRGQRKGVSRGSRERGGGNSEYLLCQKLLFQEWGNGPNRNDRNEIEKAPISSAELCLLNLDSSGFRRRLLRWGGGFCSGLRVRLFQEIEYGFFDRRGVSFDDIFKSNRQRVELCEALGNVMAVRLASNKIVQGTSAKLSHRLRQRLGRLCSARYTFSPNFAQCAVEAISTGFSPCSRSATL